MRKIICFVGVGIVFLALAATQAQGQSSAPAAGAASTGPLLGSPDFKATPEHPLGWRGDGSGRYVAATPPTQWGRWAKTAIRDLRCQGAKPKGADGATGAALPFGRVENWLIIGPIPIAAPANQPPPAPADAAAKPDKAAEELAKAQELQHNTKLLEDELIAKEADLAPDAGEKVNDLLWAAFQAGGENQNGGAGQSGVEFFRVLPKPTGTFASYAFTNIYAPADVKVTLRMHMPTAMKVWVNGKAVCAEPKAPYNNNKEVVVDLVKGWNRLLCKGIYQAKADPKAPVDFWRLTATLLPTEKAFAYETSNVAWMTPMPAHSTSLPLIVGDKIFVTSNYADLLCINKADGKILWLRSNSYYDVMTGEERAAKPEIQSQVEPEVVALRGLNDELVKELNGAVSATGLPSDQAKALGDKLVAKGKQEMKINDLMVKLGVNKRPMHSQHVGSANGTPCTDGTRVWAVFGGGIYSGPLTVVCYDLEGTRLWARGFADVNAGEHGDHCSPLLVEGKLVVQSIGSLRVLDAQSGADVWSTNSKGPGDNGGGSPIATKIGGETVIIGPRRDVWLLKDGKSLYLPDAQAMGHNLGTPVLYDGVLYQLTGWGTSNFSAFKLPDALSEPLKLEKLYQVPQDPTKKYKDFAFVDSVVGSPLYADGFVYYLTEGGVLHASDAATGAAAYSRMMTEMRTRVQWVFWNGACGSPTLAGKNIYVTDDCGITAIVAPGKEFKLVGVNTLENFSPDFNQEQSLGTPIFEGKCMYYRTPGYLYCIGGK